METIPQYEEARSIRRKLKKEGEKKPSKAQELHSKKLKLSQELLEAQSAINIAMQNAYSFSNFIEEDLLELELLETNKDLSPEEKARQIEIVKEKLLNHQYIFDKTISTWVNNAVKCDSIQKTILHLDTQYLQ